MKHYLLLISMLLICNLTIGQQSYFYKIDSENSNFPSNEVYEIQQDSFGFLWIGCDAGIFRYDGVKFKQYVHPKENGRSLSHLFIDEKQQVWFQNFAGQIFYIYQDSIYLFKDFSKEESNFPRYIVENNEVFVVLKGVTYVYDANSKKLKRKIVTSEAQILANANHNYQSDVVQLFANPITQQINYSTRANIFYRKYGEQKVNKIFESRSTYYVPRVGVIDGVLYFLILEKSTKDWLFATFENDKLEIKKRFPPDAFDFNIYMIKKVNNSIGICTANGLYLFDKNFNPIRHLFPNEKISDVLSDREGNLWLTSLQNGIYVIPYSDLKIYSDDFFVEGNISTLSITDDKLLVGTFLGNIFEFNPKTENLKTIKTPKHPRFSRSKRIIENEDYRVYALGANTVFLNRKTGRQDLGFDHFANIRDMVFLKDSLFYTNSYRTEIINLDNQGNRLIKKGGGRAITRQPNSENIYFADKSGFYHYLNGQVTEIQKNGTKVYPASMDWQGDTLWIGTFNDGILAYHNGQFVKHIFEKKAGVQNMVRAIRVYKNWLLAATDLGLVRMNLQNEVIEIIERSDGLHQKEIMRIEVINDEVFLATTVGMIRFPLDIRTRNSIVPNIALNAVFVNDSVQVGLDKQYFEHTENNILFQFQTALFRSRKAFYYEYRLKGLNNRWQQTNAAAPFAQYRSLPAGIYIFEVRAVNEDGLKSRVERFKFSVAAPIWLRWWFIVAVFCTLALLTYLLVNLRIHRIKRQARIENELKTSQLTALKAQMNPHFLYNALNSIQDLILQKDVKNAVRYLTKFSHLMRQILDASGMTSISLSDEIKILQLYLDLEKLRFGDDFQYNIELENRIDDDLLQIPPMIIQPFVENAVKHGLLHKTKGIKHLTINFKKEDLLICTIIDNGVGRVKAAQIQARQANNKTSFATSATQKRLDILNETYKQKIGLEIIDLVDNNISNGTKVILRIPFKNHS